MPNPITNPKNGVKAKIICPAKVFVNKMPPVPNHLSAFAHVTLILQNTTRSDFVLSAPTPCAVHFWELFDSAGDLVQTQPRKMCAQHVVTAPLPAGKSIREDVNVELNGKLLIDGETYTIQYKFWGYQSSGTFVAEIVQ
jgi:hypothetical protein